MIKLFRYGDNIDTDVIIPARYLSTADPASLAAHCMEDIDPSFASRVKTGDIMFAGENFGCGSSREHAPLAIKASGVSAVVAKSFARIFFRNAVNIGLPVLECPEAADAAKENSSVSVDLSSGTVTVDGKTFRTPPAPPFVRKIIASGGLLNAVAKARDAV